MKRLLILSGKGGTGKTTIAAAFIEHLQAKSYADCDVDAPNLHLVVPPDGEPVCEHYYSLPKAEIDQERCVPCEECGTHCKFQAIRKGERITIDRMECEGCGVCEYVCPVHAISLTECISGETKLYEGEKHFSTAELKMGSGATGKLVSQVKKKMKKLPNGIAVIDGSPGIGCPVIASITGVDMVLLVTEPTVSGLRDLERVLRTIEHFGTRCAVCVNKYTLHIEQSNKIVEFCKGNQIPVVGKIPYDEVANQAINEGRSIIQMGGNAAVEILSVIRKTIEMMEEDNYV